LDRHFFNESEMALFSECMLQCARKVLDTADIVREAILRQLCFSRGFVFAKSLLAAGENGVCPIVNGIKSEQNPADPI
jgi:hypothetical protein